MRFASLGLERYGAFTSRIVRFHADARVHVIYGRNEAGKSTALAATRDLLFGFPTKTPYDFLHKQSDLRLLGEVVARDGRTLAFGRRKGNARTLLDAAGAALADDALAPFLGGLTLDVFRRAFGLDAKALREGADELLRSRGDVGGSLMAAVAGLRGLSELRKTLDAEADAIYSDRRFANRTFYQALDRRETARKAVRDLALRASDWTKLGADIESHDQRLDAIKESRAQAATQRNRLERLIRLKPRVAAIDAASATLDALGEAATLPKGFGVKLADALDALTAAQKQHQQARENADATSRALTDIAVDRALIARRADVARLFADVGNYDKARLDRPAVREQASEFRSQALEIAARLGVGDLEELKAGRPTDAALAEARKRSRDGEAIERQRIALEQAVADEDAVIAACERARASHGALADPAPLREKLAALGDVGALVKERARIGPKLSDAARALAEDAARMNPPIVDLEAFARASPPNAEAMGRFADAARATDAQLRDARKSRADARDEAARLDMQLRDLADQRPVPTRERVAAARAERDVLWTKIRAAAFNEASAPAGALLAETVARFETARDAADALVDEAAHDADRVSRHRAAVDDLARWRAGVEDAEQRLRTIEADRNADEARWRDAWRSIGIEPLAPTEMLAWLSAAQGLLARRADLKAQQSDLAATLEDLERLAAPLQALAATMDLPPLADLDVGRLAARTADRLKAIEAAWDAARDDETRWREAKRRRAESERKRAEAANALERWRGEWREVARALGLSPTSSREAAAAALDAWAETPGALANLYDRERRVRGMTRDIERFETDAAGLVEAIAPDLAGAPANEAARELQRRFEAATAAAVRREAATQRDSEQRQALEEATRKLAQAREGVASLAALAPAGADLAALCDTLRGRDSACDALDQARSDFILVANGLDEAIARAELATFEADDAQAQIEALAREEDALEDERNTVFAERNELLKRRDTLNAGVGAEVAAQQRRNAEADLHRLGHDWAALKIGALLLETALDRQRATRRDPLLARAGALFETLTGGGFAGLEQTFDEKDEPRLVGRRANGETLNVDQLSEGARDQMFLALRLAYVEDYATRAEPAPFLADDLFASFDDARTEHALRSLGALAAHTQAIVFTHHRHVVDLAERALGGDVDVIALG